MGSANGSKDTLEVRAIAQFDRLCARGELLWAESVETKYPQEPFPVYFRLAPQLLTKPFNPHDTSRKPGFLDDNPDFTLCDVAPSHKLILNKFCTLRPQMLLHTREFESQLDLLTHGDLEASWDVLRELGEQYLVIFNGGPAAGSSVAHKHLQMVPRPAWKIFPDVLLEKDGNAISMKGVPYDHLIQALPPNSTSSSIYEHYIRMCKQLGVQDKHPAHNIILTHSWLLVLPGLVGGIDGNLCQAGAIAMIGWVWAKTEQQIEHWRELGPMNVLARFGVPRE